MVEYTKVKRITGVTILILHNYIPFLVSPKVGKHCDKSKHFPKLVPYFGIMLLETLFQVFSLCFH
jgi:hypothetical protein